MPFEITVRDDRQIVQVNQTGALTLAEARTGEAQVAAVVQASGFRGVMVDLRMAEPVNFRSLTDWYDLATTTAQQFGQDISIGVVYEPSRWKAETLSFVETASYHHGLLLRHFTTEHQALTWLNAVTR
jgi:hypothetical protein